jgi:hypothetical protein
MGDAADNWNAIQSKIAFQPADQDLDVLAYDDNTLQNAYGLTQIYSQSCNSGCIGQINECTGACMDALTIYYVNIAMDATDITTYAHFYGEFPGEFATSVAAHELGHTLRVSRGLLGKMENENA